MGARRVHVYDVQYKYRSIGQHKTLVQIRAVYSHTNKFTTSQHAPLMRHYTHCYTHPANTSHAHNVPFNFTHVRGNS